MKSLKRIVLLLLVVISFFAALAARQYDEKSKPAVDHKKDLPTIQSLHESSSEKMDKPDSQNAQELRDMPPSIRNSKLPLNLGSVACPPGMDCREKERAHK